MTFEYMLKERERIGIEQGREQGRSEGLAEGEAIGLKKGRSEGDAIGLEKGRSEGAVQEKRAIAKVMKEKSISNTEISEITGLSVEEVDKL